jgi:hypothetical protein
MEPIDHLRKASRIERSRMARLDASDDYELIIWSCIHGGAHLLNAALHAAGLTESEQDYIRSDKIDPGLALPVPVADVVKSLRSIEALGAKFVRGGEVPESATVRSCIDAYDAAKRVAEGLARAQVP